MTYTVKDLIEELKHYPEDAEVHFNLEDDIVPSDALINYEVDRYGQIQKFEIVQAQLEITFCSDWSGDCEIDLEVAK